MIRTSTLYLIIITILFLNACKTPKKDQKIKQKEALSELVLSNFSTSSFNFDKLSAKIEVSTDIDGKKQSFTANIRMKKDSILWVSVSPFLGIEVMRIVLTQDSTKILNRLENTYFLSDNNYLKTLLKADVDFNMLQAVIMGNDFPHFESKIFDVKRKDDSYCLEVKNRTKLKNIYNNSNLAINQDIYLDTATYKIIKNNFRDKEENYKFELVYSNFKTIEKQLFPYKFDCKIVTGNKSSVFAVEYSKINMNINLTYPFAIPDKYTKMP